MPAEYALTARREAGAVLFADVVGYSRLVGENEALTLQAVDGCLRQFEAECAAFGGELLETRGDSVLLFFESAGGAVRFAIEMQRRIEHENKDLPDDLKIRFRIGIHFGEVVRDHRGVHGDIVNIAARLQSIAGPGQVYVSAPVYEQIREHLRYGYEFLGPQILKNIREPVPVYRVRSEVDGVVMAPSIRLSVQTRDKPDGPTVAVLPFENRGGGNDESWFADGITEDITISLSKFKNLFVIARSSAFLLEASAARPQKAARELGIRYLTYGTVRHAGSRVRITVELIDTTTERTIWGESYNRPIDDIFAVQNEITETIVAATAVQIEANEQQWLRQGGLPSNLAAYSYVLQGQQHLFRYTRQENREAHGLYRQALEADPEYARAWAALSRTVNLSWRYSWEEEGDSPLDTALAYARSAVQLDPTDARGFGELGFVHLWRKEHEASISAYQRALALNPNDADLMSDMADALVFSGRPSEAITLLERAMQLNPFYPDEYLWHLAGALYDLRDYDRRSQRSSR